VAQGFGSTLDRAERDGYPGDCLKISPIDKGPARTLKEDLQRTFSRQLNAPRAGRCKQEGIEAVFPGF